MLQRMRFFAPLLVANLLLPACATPAAEAPAPRKILAREKSPYAWITVSEADNKRFISIGGQEQSALDLTDKRQWVYKYTYLLSLAVLAHQNDAGGRPLRCLVIGLGGGSFADFLADAFPQWKIRVVEIDPVMIRLAKRFFPINNRIEITEADGRTYLSTTQEKYDVIVMDAFGDTFIPPELYTLEFYALMKSRLQPKGVVLMNTWENESLDARELATLQRVFHKGFYLQHPQERPGNRIYLLSDELDSAPIVKARIAEKFARHKFPGHSPRAVLDHMIGLHATVRSVSPITDANVRAVLKNAAMN
ncbi:MAG: fused MFS/spermidine synthase [Turneriella sp.]